MVLNNQINWEGYDQLLPQQIVFKVNSLRIQLKSSILDKAIWSADNNGSFSVASACHLFRKKQHKTWVNTMNWQKGIPFKMNFIVWRDLRDKIPTDARVTKLGYSISSRCCCGGSPGVEDVDHLFYTGSFAKNIWKVLCGPLGIAHSEIPFRQLMVNWWRCKVNNPVHAFLIKCLPAIASWKIWKARCNAKYDNVRANVRRLISLIAFSVAQLVNN
ncbi:uncharacterized protein [Nicotiana sylvestris]|uniref:uncharacterized protein n=1 Tax=Nicotiana sylvestris TaxID=4096 RepID=UPI00388C54A9